MRTISEVGENRLSRILAGDKNQSPERLCGLIKSDIKMLVNNYVELVEDVEIVMEIIEDEFNFYISFKASRMKNLGIIP